MKIFEIKENVESRLHTLCDGLSPKRRFVIVITALFAFGVMAIYMAASPIFEMDRPELDVEHMKELKLRWAQNDSIETLKFKTNDCIDE